MYIEVYIMRDRNVPYWSTKRSSLKFYYQNRIQLMAFSLSTQIDIFKNKIFKFIWDVVKKSHYFCNTYVKFSEKFIHEIGMDRK